jgi:hypothetical protein
LRPVRVEERSVSSFEYAVAPRTVDVLPTRVARRVTSRDGLLPLVLSLELAVGMAFGLAAHSGGSGATSVPAKLTLAPVAQVTVLPSSAPSAPAYGPVIGPLRPGTVRPTVGATVTVQPPTVRKHAPRNPFGALVPSAS